MNQKDFLSKKALLAGAVVACMTLTACGGSDSSDNSNVGRTEVSNTPSKPNTSNNQILTFYQLDFDFSNNNERSIFMRQFTYKTAQEPLEKTIDIIGNAPISDEDNYLEDIILAKGFEGNFKRSDLKVKGYNITFNSYQGNKQISQTLEFVPFDLTGIGAKDYNQQTERGVYTDLVRDNFKLPENLVFPKGSLCYTVNEISNENHFSFNLKGDTTPYKTLNEWVRSNRLNFDIEKFNKDYDVKYFNNLGKDGQSQAVVLTDLRYPNDKNVGVLYKGKVYQADFHAQGKNIENRDPKTGTVECTTINKTASDFLIKEVRSTNR